MPKPLSPSAVLLQSVRNTLNSLKGWECGALDSSDEPDDTIVFEHNVEKPGRCSSNSKNNSNSNSNSNSRSPTKALLNALNCSAVAKTYGCQLSPSGDLSDEITEEEQLRRLGSWGTFGSMNTAESIDTNFARSSFVDDDGNPIHPVLLGKAKERREKHSNNNSNNHHKKRLVQFAYPPISTLKQCPRIDPEDVNRLFFTAEELDLYEQDRKLTNIVDDVEIVAVATSSETSAGIGGGDSASLAEDTRSNNSSNYHNNNKFSKSSFSPMTANTGGCSITAGSTATPPKSPSGFGKYIPSPMRKALQEQDQHHHRGTTASGTGGSSSSSSRQFTRSERKSSNSSRRQNNRAGTPPSSRRQRGSTGSSCTNNSTNSNNTNDENNTTSEREQHQQHGNNKKKDKRLLKSVQIFLRERSTGRH